MSDNSVLANAQPGLLLVVRGTLAVGAVASVITGSHVNTFVATLAFALTFVPTLLRRSRVIDLPLSFEVTAAIFVLATLFLGNLHGYYTRFWWWDLLLHGSSAVALGLTGYLILTALLQASRSRTSPILVAIFTISFALAIGALWELIEFSIDITFGTHMQLNSLLDTMEDLAIDALGALCAGVAAGLHAQGIHGWGVLDRLRQSLRERNPELFRRKQKRNQK